MNADEKQLKKTQRDLLKLQVHGSVVAADMRRAHQNLHIHLSEIYFWWKLASEQGDYLEKEYKKLGKKFKTVSYGINFGPVLWLVYGNNNGLNNRYADRFSRAMNAMHMSVNEQTDFYKKDSVNKLSNFIQQAGGITALAGYAAPEDDLFVEKKPTNKIVAKQEANKTQDLLKQSYMLDEFRIDKKDIIPFPAYVKTTPENFSLLLVQRTDAGFNIVDVDNDSARVNFVLANALRKRFDLCVFSIRPMLELIQTQCLPKHLEGLAEKLVEQTELPDEKKKKFLSHRRVMYRAQTKEFILSPINALSGVVSIIKPYFDLVLDGCDKDVYMPYIERNQIEKNLLRNFEFNLYDTELKTLPIPEYPELNTASHVLNLRHRTQENEFQNISFWPFYSSLEQPQDQLLINPDYPLIPKWYAHIDKDEIKRVNDGFLEKWLNGHGTYLVREPHTILKVTFGDTWWVIEFVLEDNEFVNVDQVKILPIEVSPKSATAYFKTKDFIPAIKCLSDLQLTKAIEKQRDEELDAFDIGQGIVLQEFIPEEVASYKGGVWFELDDNVLSIKFCTDTLGGAEHMIYVPTVDKAGVAATQPFYRYHPDITMDETNLEEIEQLIDDQPELIEMEQ